MDGLLEMTRKNPPRKWTAIENYKLRDAVERLGNTKEAVAELVIRLPHLTKRQIQNKMFAIFGNRADNGNKTEYVNKEHHGKVNPIDWNRETKSNFELFAKKHGAYYSNGILMKDGKRVTIGQLVG